MYGKFCSLLIIFMEYRQGYLAVPAGIFLEYYAVEGARFHQVHRSYLPSAQVFVIMLKPVEAGFNHTSIVHLYFIGEGKYSGIYH